MGLPTPRLPESGIHTSNLVDHLLSFLRATWPANRHFLLGLDPICHASLVGMQLCQPRRPDNPFNPGFGLDLVAKLVIAFSAGSSSRSCSESVLESETLRSNLRLVPTIHRSILRCTVFSLCSCCPVIDHVLLAYSTVGVTTALNSLGKSQCSTY